MGIVNEPPFHMTVWVLWRDFFYDILVGLMIIGGEGDWPWAEKKSVDRLNVLKKWENLQFGEEYPYGWKSDW